MLATHIDYIQKQQKTKKLPNKVEIVIVDDGSRDKTWTIIQEWVKKYSDTNSSVIVIGLRLKVNQGKGMAVKYGALFSKGQFILMVDADGATDFKEITKIFKQIQEKSQNGLGCVIGNRNHDGNQAKVQRKGIRKLLNKC